MKEKTNTLAMKLTSAKGQLKLAQDTPPFTTVLRWRKADNFQITKRDWESFWGFYWLYNDFPKHESVENFIYAAFASCLVWSGTDGYIAPLVYYRLPNRCVAIASCLVWFALCLVWFRLGLLWI